MTVRKLLTLACALFACAPAVLYGQTANITGTVTDAGTGQVLAGASVRLDDSDRGALSNVDGRYTISGVSVGTHTVTASYIGYADLQRTVTVSTGTNTLDFGLQYDPVKLDAIVVTAQQIERQKRELAYSVSTIESGDLVKAPSTNFVSDLAGKSAGVDVISQSGDVGASTRIVIRGVSSLSGDNQPLFVVDGIPISNSNIVAGTSQDRLTGAIDVGNRGGDLNPEDIQSVTVLKGGAAAALYGQRAKDGVILITTKRGRNIGGETVTATSSLRVSSPLVLPDFQNTYAQGSAGAYQSTSLNGWGPTIAGQRVENIRGDSVTLQPYPDNVRDFYQNGILAINSFSFSSANDVSDFRLGITNQDQNGIVPSSNLRRTTVNINAGYHLTDKFHARLSGSYVDTNSKGKAVAGGNDPNVLTTIVNGLPRTFDMGVLKDYKDAEGNQIPLDNFNNNPYWVANENKFTDGVERVFGSGTLQFDPVSWVTLTGRAGLDTYTENRRNINAVSTVGRENGLFSLDVIEERQVTADLMAEANRDLTSDFSLRGVLGFNLNTRQQQIQRNDAAELTVPGLYNFANAQSNAPVNSSLKRRLYGVYVDATLGYRQYLFLNVTGRNDWSSTLPKNHNSFFYPSVNLSWVFTDALGLAGDVLSYGKLRANYAIVGSDEDPYQLDFRYFPVSSIFGQYGTGNTFPYGGLTGFQATNTIPPADLKPQNQASFELGTELQFYNGRAGIDFTYYDTRTKDQIISIPVPQTTGFGANRTNIGEVSNKGIEAQLNFNPIRNRTFNWEANLNYTQNKNRVVSLAPGVDQLTIQSAFNSLQVKAEPGKSFGLYGPGFLRDSVSGLPIIDPNTGLRQEGDIIRLGDIDPKFRLSLNNTFSVNHLSLSFLVDWRQGGSMFSETVAELRRSGLASETAVNRDGTFIDKGVIDNGDGTFRPNDVPVQNMQAFWGRYASASIMEGNIFDATNVRLREVRLQYQIPRSWIENTPFGSMSVGLEGRNLFLLYKKIPHIDPETGLFGSAANGQGIEWDVLPSTRSFGLDLQVRF